MTKTVATEPLVTAQQDPATLDAQPGNARRPINANGPLIAGLCSGTGVGLGVGLGAKWSLFASMGIGAGAACVVCTSLTCVCACSRRNEQQPVGPTIMTRA